MDDANTQSYSAFDGHKLLTQGQLSKVVLNVKKRLKEDSSSSILIFSDLTGKQMDFDLRGTEQDILQRLQVFVSAPTDETKTASGPGRPKLGVISREVSLLPRHWEWLSTQSGGASVTLRKLVDEARKRFADRDETKKAQERTYKFLSSIAGNFPHYEEALRNLFAKNKKAFELQITDWPKDIKLHASSLAAAAFKG